MQTVLGTKTFETRFVGGVAYLDLSALVDVSKGTVGAVLLGSARWVRIDPAVLGLQGAQKALSGTTDPSGQIDVLRGITDAQPVGTEQVRGVTTTHYHGTVDVSTAVAKLPAKVRAKVQLAVAPFGATFPVDVWLDDGHLVRKFQITVGGTTTDSQSPQSVRDVAEFELYDFGVSVKVSAPAKDTVIDYSRFLSLVAAAQSK